MPHSVILQLNKKKARMCRNVVLKKALWESLETDMCSKSITKKTDFTTTTIETTQMNANTYRK